MDNLNRDIMPLKKPPVFSERTAINTFFSDILNSGLNLRVKVTGRSMLPFLRGGEIVIIKKVPCAELRIGDLIFFESSQGVLVLHRIVRKKLIDNGAHIFQTRGDGLMALDEEINENSVLGKVLLIERPSQSGKTTHINMNSLFYRCMNFSIAVAGFFKTQTWFFLSAALAKKYKGGQGKTGIRPESLSRALRPRFPGGL